MQPIRPAGAGRQGTASPFMRQQASPRAGLVIIADVPPPADWQLSEGGMEDNLSHAAGWTCEVRRGDIVLLDPLGEGLAKADLVELSAAWLANVRHDGSCAVYLAPTEAESGFAELTMASAAATGRLLGATIRTAVSGDYGAVAAVGRNEPCPCGSGRKYKHCHG